MQNRRRLAGETGWIFIVQRPRTSNGYKAKVFKRLIARKGLGRPSNQGLGHFRRSPPCGRSFTAGRLRHYFRRRRPQRPVSHDAFPRRRGRTYLYYFRRHPLSSHQQAGRHPSGYISGVNRGRTVRRLSAVFLKLLFTLARRYGAQVEDFLKVYLRTPGLPQEDVTKALLARGAARRAAAEKLMVRAHEGTSTLRLPASGANRGSTDFQTLSRLDPSNRQVQSLLQLSKQVRPSSFQHPLYLNRFQPYSREEPACHRTPLEIWDRIASYIPRYHLRMWLFVSAFHRDIAQRHIFSTVDLHLGEDQEHRNRALDFFDRIKEDSAFAKKVKKLRLHWSYEEGDTFDLVARESSSSSCCDGMPTFR